MPETDLGRLQRWMQAVITDPEGPLAGSRSAEARAALASEIDALVRPSSQLRAEERIGIYARMGFERFLETLEEDFPALRDALGEAGFRSQMRRYLAAHPSTHWSLSRLGAALPGWLREAEHVEGRAFLAELAALERAVQEAFDAPPSPVLSPEELLAVPAQAWDRARIETSLSLRLLAFEHPVGAFYQAFRDSRPRPVVERRPSWLAVYRREHRVWRLDLCPEAHALLAGLAAGLPLAEALAGAGPAGALAPHLGAWFREWTADGLLAALRVV